MEKLIEFCKKKYKILIPVMVVFVLLLTIYFLYKEYKYDNYRNRKEIAVFQYFGGVKNEYDAIVTYNLNKTIIGVSAKDKKIEYDSTPIYYSKKNKIIFPNEMSIVFPLKEGSQYKLYKYSTYQKKDNLNIIKSDVNTFQEYYFFLYDGKGLFFFPDEVKLNIDGREYRSLSAMSYVHIVGGYTLTYYDREKDESEVIEIEGKKITVISDSMNVNLSERYCMSFGNKVLLVNPYNLNALNN